MVQEFRQISGYPDYAISNYGRVKSYKHGGKILLKNRTMGKSKENTGWRPYQQVVLYINSKQHQK